ncbi:hypothetical protein EIP91_000421 [Steccherinum ochraceum]|uniref:AB hydrolase-1 domain-containing protein n=1 Tax=Steccherinum ochraceum TaxID=92696 RepID=A0A4R0RWF1_9APHY|nr:hypothetical protein EIP91_000421 [Steccherinum ochraceum]
MKLLVEDIVLDGNAEHGGFKHAFKRYYPVIQLPTRPGVSLVLLHCLGTHKETWEPVLERLFDLQAREHCKSFIADAWSMDCPNHGQAGVLNETLLLKKPQGVGSDTYDWARGLRVLLSSGLIRGEFIVGVGHSAGAAVLLISTLGLSPQQLPFSSFIFVEPALMTQYAKKQSSFGNSERHAIYQYLLRTCRTRMDVWESREAALRWLSARNPWNGWDPRILRLFVTCALRDLPTALYPDTIEGVTLACTREQEAVCYTYLQDGVDALERLAAVCASIPVHCILGDRIDFVPEDVRRATLDVRMGRTMASIHTISGAGHLVIQEKPDAVTDAMWAILAPLARSGPASKL